MKPLRLFYYLVFIVIESVAIVGALLGVVFLFVPFVAVKAVVTLTTGRGRGAQPVTASAASPASQSHERGRAL